jgi:hypothetical protein
MIPILPLQKFASWHYCHVEIVDERSLNKKINKKKLPLNL